MNNCYTLCTGLSIVAQPIPVVSLVLQWSYNYLYFGMMVTVRLTNTPQHEVLS